VHIHGSNGASVGVQTDSGATFVAGMSGIAAPPVNDLWTIPGEEDLPERWLAADRAALAAVDVASHYHELQLRDVVAAIREGRPPAVTGQDGLRTVELMAAIYQASRDGGRVRIPSRGADAT
jgi:predicted dehydrogenase